MGDLHEIDVLEVGWTRRPDGRWTRVLGPLGSAVVMGELRRSSCGWSITVSVHGEADRRLYRTAAGQDRPSLIRAKRLAVAVYRQAVCAYELASRFGGAV